MLKITNKKTVMFFRTTENQKECIGYLIAINVKFRAALKNNWVEVAPKQYKRHELDLLLPYHVGVTTFNYKF